LEIKQFGKSFDLYNFDGCTNLKFNLSMDNFPPYRPNGVKYTTLASVFANCTSLKNNNVGLEKIDLSSCNSIATCFLNDINFNQDIELMDTSTVLNFSNFLNNALAFNFPLGKLNVSAGTNFSNFMLYKTSLNYSAENYDGILNGWTDRSLNPSLTISFWTIKHTAGATQAKALLTRANATVAISNTVDNGSGLIRVTSAAHGRTTGEKIFILGVLGTTEANGGWVVTVISATELDLQSSVFANTYTSGGTLRIGYGWTIVDGGI